MAVTKHGLLGSTSITYNESPKTFYIVPVGKKATVTLRVSASPDSGGSISGNTTLQFSTSSTEYLNISDSGILMAAGETLRLHPEGGFFNGVVTAVVSGIEEDV